MNRLRGPIGMISAWLLVVAVGSAMVWTVISRAGNDLMPAASASLRASSPAPEKTVAATPTPSKPQETGKPTLIKSKEPDPPAPSSLVPSVSTPPIEEPTAPSSDPSDDQTKKDDRDHWDDGHWGDKDNNQPPPEKIRRTWQGTGGFVVAECFGWKISLISAPANSGFHVEVATWERGVRAVFENQDGSGQKTFVFGRCQEGTPAFFARTDDGTANDGDNTTE